MDLLSFRISKEPSAYQSEYLQQVESFRVLSKLPNQPTKHLKRTLDFLIKHPHPSISEVLLESLKTVSIKKEVMSGLFLLVDKKILSLDALYESILEYSDDCLFYINRLSNYPFSDFVIEKFEKYKSDSKKKAFCYYFVVNASEGSKLRKKRERILCEGLFDSSLLKHFVTFTTKNGEGIFTQESLPYARRFYSELGRYSERESRILKMKAFVILKKSLNMKESISKMALDMLDGEKEDVGDILRLVVEDTNKENMMEVVRMIIKEYCSAFKEEEMICYGLNMIREILSHEGKEEDEDRKEDEVRKEEPLSIPDSLREMVLDHLETFRKCKSRKVAYAYKSVMNLFTKRKEFCREVDFVLGKRRRQEEEPAVGREDAPKRRAGSKKKKGRNGKKGQASKKSRR